MVRRPSPSADAGLSRPAQVRWLARTALRAATGEMAQVARPAGPAAVSPAALGAGAVDAAALAERAGPRASPGRLLSVHLTLHACRLAGRLVDRPVRVLDLGCGTGGYLPFFREHLDGFAGYTGVDVAERPEWGERADEDASFVAAPAEAFTAALGGADHGLVYSNSALEHMGDDLAVAAALGAWSRRLGKPVVQLHIVPASAGLALYRLHGHRVYDGRDVRRLASLLAGDGHATLVALGGRRSWWLHLRHLQERETAPERYARRLDAATAHDAAAAPPRLPVFWAILVTPTEPGRGAGGARA